MENDQNSHELPEHEEIYKDLYNVVKITLGSNIDKKRIEKSIHQIINIFTNEPYNPLLLYFYSISKENYLISHIVNNVILAVGFGVSLDLTEENMLNLGLCSFCHDFGMKEFTHLFQQDKKLSDHENKMIQKHSLRSMEMFKDIFSEEIVTAIGDVHEQVDGRGYPKEKSGSEISFLAKIVSICDVFEALTHQRSSRKKTIPYEAIKLIIKQKDHMFDDKLVKRFVDFISIHPVGSLIYLNTGEIGIVIGSNYGYPTRCIVRVLLTANQEVDQSNKVFNLLSDTMIYMSGPVQLDEENEILKVLKPRGNIEFEELKS